LGDLNFLSWLECATDLHYFIHASAGSNFTDECVRQQCETFTELNEATNSGFLSDLAMEGSIVPSGKQYAGNMDSV